MYLDKLTFVPTKRFYYGWVIVAAAAITMFFSGPGQTYSISVFIDSYIKDFGWSRSLVSSIYSTATLIAGSLLFIVGRFIDKYGHKYMGVVIASLLGIACMWSSFVINPVMLFIGFFMLRLFGQGSMTLLSSTLVPQWFVKKRGLALSLMALGSVTSSAVLPPLNTYIIDTWGWSVAWRFWAVLLWLVFVPISFFFIHSRPENIGLLPDNRIKKPDNKDTAVDTERSEVKKHKEISWTLQEAMKTRAFWFMMFCQMVPSMINTGITFHFISILGEKGLSHTLSALILSIVAIIGFPATFFAGYMLDRIHVHFVEVSVFVIHLISLLVLVYGQSSQMAVLFGILMGVVSGLQGVTNNVVWASYFGRKYLGSIRGFSMSSIIIGSAFGPLPFGIAFDVFGGYTGIIMIMMIFPVLGAIAAMVSPAPKKK
ncbi:MFS transporter [Petroclostridium sp. X23]|uniref:MFS transporter n=1 Tax=Petroclostridium sp. X23 TaxID=3045146 RepID=UPI0024ADECF1|nr:MFS transporter [Petroclostridium sp. X23]WHH60947.1 MFS transporter [Petroclostridium sp. X23]